MEQNRNVLEMSKYFSEEVISLVLLHHNIAWNPPRSPTFISEPYHSEINRNIRTVTNGVIYISSMCQEDLRLRADVIWNYLQSFEVSERSRKCIIILILTTRFIFSEEYCNLKMYIFMGLISYVCIMCCIRGQDCLVNTAVTALQNILSHMLPGGFTSISQGLVTFYNNNYDDEELCLSDSDISDSD